MHARIAQFGIVTSIACVLVVAAPSATSAQYRAPSPAGHFDGQPAFSPDGRLIAAFVRGSTAAGGAANGLTLINTALWERMSVGDAPPQLSWRSTMSFSPDGRHLLVNAAAGSAFADLWAMDVATRKWSRLTGNDGAPSRAGLGKWSPDGTHLISGGSGRAWTMWSDAGVTATIPFGDWPESAVADVAWSADGESLWVAVNAEAAPDTNTAVSVETTASRPVAGLYRVALGDLSAELVAPLDSIRSASASPAGGVVACVTRGGKLVLVDPADQTVHALGDGAGELTWSRNGALLAVESVRGPALYDVGSRRRVKLPTGAESIFFNPGGGVWGARGAELVSLSDGRWAPRFRLGERRAMQLAVRDLNGDLRVDAWDILIFVQCAAGPNRPPLSTCPPGVNVDYDQDNDVDLADYAIFNRDVHPQDFRRTGGVIISH